MVVAAAADVLVPDGQLVGHGLGAAGPVEAAAQDGLHRAVAAGADIQAALAGRLQPFRPVAAHEPQDPQAGPEPLLRVRPGGQDPLDQGDGVGADRLRLAQQPCGRPLGVASVCAGHVLGSRRVSVLPRVAEVAGDAVAAVEQLDALVGDAGLDDLAHQAVGHGVEVAVHLDVVVEPGPAAPPLCVGVWIGRQRQQGIALDCLEQGAAGGAQVAHRPVVQVGGQLADRAVQLGQGEEPPVAQPGQDPALHDLDGNLDLGLVARLAHPRRQDRRAVVGGHVLVGPADARLVAAGRGDAGLEVVADDLARDTTEAGKGAHVAADPVRQRLRPARLRVGEVGRAQHGHEDLGLPDLLAGRVPGHGVGGR